MEIKKIIFRKFWNIVERPYLRHSKPRSTGVPGRTLKNNLSIISAYMEHSNS